MATFVSVIGKILIVLYLTDYPTNNTIKQSDEILLNNVTIND